MSIDIHTINKQTVRGFAAAMYDIEADRLQDQLGDFIAPDCAIHLGFPFEDLDGPRALHDLAYRPLLESIPDLERRDYILMAGESRGENWVGCAGFYTGVFQRPWLDIPPSQHIVGMRYHEFFRFIDGRVVEMHAVWDIPQLMMSAGAWPLAPSLGHEWLAPGPATQDGDLTAAPYDPEHSASSLKIVEDMLIGLGRSSQGVEAMELDRFWHPKMNWYGPAGIGTGRGISGFRNWHQIPFLKAMPDREVSIDGGVFFADGNYVGYTAWPGMHMTLSGDGWMGIAASGQKLSMRSLDFWRCKNGLIRENWVLIDLLHIYNQIEVDVFERMREFSYARRVCAHTQQLALQ